MDHIRPTAIAIPLETWLANRADRMERFGHPHQQDMRCTPASRIRSLWHTVLNAMRALIHGT